MPTHALSARFELVTPAFASGAQPQVCAELRVEAIIGQLRRWWWAQAPLDAAFDGPEAANFADTLFGAAGSEDGAAGGKGQGAFLITLRQSSVVAMNRANGLRELFGPLWSRRSQWLWTNSNNARPGFTVDFLVRPSKLRGSKHDDRSLIRGLRRALSLWGLLGGMGAGQRRGFGSVQLMELKVPADDEPNWSFPSSPTEYVTRIVSILPTPIASRGGPHAFGSFADKGTPPASVWMAGLPNCADGKAALQSIQTALVALKSGVAPREPTTISVLSNQFNPNPRKPSPFHFHVARVGTSMCVVLSVLQRAGGYPANRADWITGRDPTGNSLVQRVGMTRVLPGDAVTPT